MARNTRQAVQQYRGTTEQHSVYTGPVGELTVDTTKKVVVVQDGTTAGGIPMAREDRRLLADGTIVTVNGAASATLGSDITVAVNMTNLASGLVSGDADNGLFIGEDGKLYANPTKADLLIRPDDHLLFAEGDKLGAEFTLSYNETTGLLNVLGYDSEIVASATIPAATSMLKGVELVDGKPDAAGSAVQGDYHLTFVVKDNQGNFTDPLGLVVTTTKNQQGSTSFSVELPEGGASVAGCRAVFMSQDESVDGTSPISLTFDDTSALQFSWTLSDTTVNGNVTFTPAVGLVAGTYLHFIWILSDGSVHDTYVDVTDLVDVYTGGQGITVSGTTISAKLGTGLSFDGSGNIIISVNNLISSTANNALKTGTDGKLTVATVSANSGNLVTTGTDAGALVTKAGITSAVVEIVTETLDASSGSIACEMISDTEGNGLQCDSGRLYIPLDFGTME